MAKKPRLTQPKTIQEKRAVQFAIDLLTKHGYGYVIPVGYVELSNELAENGVKISFMTIISYWKALERMGYATREMGARVNGVTHTLNRYAFQKVTQ